jgi:hypothetical protein
MEAFRTRLPYAFAKRCGVIDLGGEAPARVCPPTCSKRAA